MPPKKDEFQIRFPGVKADKYTQRFLLGLAKSYANYSRDVRSLNWLLGVIGNKMSKEDKVALIAARVQAELNCECIQEYMGNALVSLSVAQRSDKVISPDLEFAGKRVAPIFDKYRRDYWESKLAEYSEQYKLVHPLILPLAIKAEHKKTFDDIEMQDGIIDVINGIKVAARQLGRSSRDVFADIRYKYEMSLPEQTLSERLANVNFRKAYGIYKSIQKQEKKFVETVAECGTIHLDSRDAKDKLDRLNRDFKAVMGYSMKELEDQGFKWSMFDWNTKKR